MNSISRFLISAIKNTIVISLLTLCGNSSAFGQNLAEATPKETILRQGGNVDSLKLLRNQLDKIDDLFESVPYWLATVYDWKSKGFYDNYSMKISPKHDADIQSTNFGWKSLAVDGNIYENPRAVPKKIRKGIIDFMQSRQDSASGYFLDPAYKEEIKKSDRTRGRMLGMALSVLHSAGAEPLYTLPGESKEKRPSFLQSVKEYKSWLDKQPWDFVWTAFDHILSQGEAISSLPKTLRDSIISVTYSRAKKIQNNDGLWGKGQNIATRIGGTNKLGGFLSQWDKSLPHPDQIYNTLISWLRSSRSNPPLTPSGSGCTICVPRNVITIFYLLKPYISHPISYQDKLTILQETYRFLEYFKMPDGAFPKSENEFLNAPNDIQMEATIKQSDMNGTHLMINMRSRLYKLCGIDDPGLPNKKDFMSFLPNYKFSK